MFYDMNESRVVIHGGWANNWLSDIWSLNVSTITGPPYAIFGITPNLGPLTGKTKVTINGEGF
jgi:dynein heavy chain